MPWWGRDQPLRGSTVPSRILKGGAAVIQFGGGKYSTPSPQPRPRLRHLPSHSGTNYLGLPLSSVPHSHHGQIGAAPVTVTAIIIGNTIKAWYNTFKRKSALVVVFGGFGLLCCCFTDFYPSIRCTFDSPLQKKN